MKKLVCILGFLSFFYTSLSAQPHVKMSRLVHSFGDVKQGAILKNRSFIVHNIGNVQLDFKLKSTCDCLKAEALYYSLREGESLPVFLTLDTSKYTGEIKKVFYLLTNDPEHETVALTVKANVIAQKRDPGKIDKTITSKAKYNKKHEFYFFYSPDCYECEQIKREIIPEWEESFQVKLVPHNIDITRKSNFELFHNIQSALNKSDKGFPVIVYQDQCLAGVKEIKEKLPKLIQSYKKKNVKLIKSYMKHSKPMVQLALIPIIFAGLLDGINPCAFAAIVFLIAYLNYLQKSKKIILITGISYTFAVFVTYFSIGAGLFRSLTVLPWFHSISFWLYLLIAVFTFVLGILSIRDFLLARKNRIKEMILQLPTSFKKKIHHHIREKTKSNMIILSSFILGFVISLFELACTGQIYLPTIIYLTKTDQFTGYLYLLIYNIFFIVPLVVIFILFYFGFSSETIGKFMERHVALIKFLMGILFILLGLLLLLNRII